MNNIETSLKDGVFNITLNRPEKKNAITAEMYAQLATTLNEAAQDKTVRAVMLKGAGADFTTGNDIGLFVQTGSGPSVSPAVGFMRAVVQFNKPIIACVRGYAVGIGATVLIHCDHVVIAEDAKIRFPFVDLGLCPEFGSTLLLRELVGRRRADDWLMLGTTILAQAASVSGLANAVHPLSELDNAAQDIAKQYASKPASALTTTRRLLRARYTVDALQRITEESSVLDELRRSHEAQAIFRKFTEKSSANATTRAAKLTAPT